MLSILPFDSILIKKIGGHNMVSLEEWLNIPLPERVELVSKSRVQFYKGDQPFSVLEALRVIKEYRQAA